MTKSLGLFRTVPFDSSQDVDAGGCFKVIINPGEVIYMPGGTPHYVETPVESVVFGSNLFIMSNFDVILHAYTRERSEDYDTDNCFPDAEILFMLIISEKFKSNKREEDLKQLNRLMLHKGQIIKKKIEWMDKNVRFFACKFMFKLSCIIRSGRAMYYRFQN